MPSVGSSEARGRKVLCPGGGDLSLTLVIAVHAARDASLLLELLDRVLGLQHVRPQHLERNAQFGRNLL